MHARYLARPRGAPEVLSRTVHVVGGGISDVEGPRRALSRFRGTRAPSQNCIREIPGPMLLPVQHLHYPSHQILLMQEFPLAVLSLPQPLVCFKVKLDNDQRLDPIPVKNRQSPRSKVQLQFNR